MSPHNKKSKLVAQGPGIPYVPHRQPIKDLGKETKVQKEARNVMPTENVWDFYTKQRPISFQYYSRLVSRPFVDTTGLADQKGVFLFETLDENQALVINYLKATVNYRIDSAAANREYREPLSNLGLSYPSFEFGFNLESQDGALYDAKGSGINIAITRSDFQGFNILNENVLENGSSDTSLYIFESGQLSVSYKFLGTPNQFLNTAIGVPLAQIYWDIRGHLINRTDANLLRELILNRQ
jgi:hypothetical protein